MGVTPSQLMMGPVEIRLGIFGLAEPPDAQTAPAAGWVDAGGTMGGATLTMGQTYTPLVADQIGLAAGGQLTAQEATVATQFAEPTLEVFRAALNQLSDSAEDELEWGGEDITNSEPNYQAVMLRGRKPGGGPRMWVVRRCLSTEGIGVPFQKEGQTVVPVTFSAYYVSKTVRSVRISDKLTAP